MQYASFTLLIRHTVQEKDRIINAIYTTPVPVGDHLLRWSSKFIDENPTATWVDFKMELRFEVDLFPLLSFVVKDMEVLRALYGKELELRHLVFVNACPVPEDASPKVQINDYRTGRRFRGRRRRSPGRRNTALDQEMGQHE